MWHKGLFHYHTAFRQEEAGRISPDALSENLREIGLSFVFCAGDHGNAEGKGYWGLNTDEFAEYRDFCLASSRQYDFPFVPTPEIHLMFPPFEERHEHHCCIPMINYIPELEYQGNASLAAAYTHDIRTVLHKARANNTSVILTHPCASVEPELFCAPDPLEIPEFLKLDYYELITIRGLKHNSFDFSAELRCYLRFLKNNIFPAMASCMGVDSMQVSVLPSTEKKIIPITCLYVEDKLSVDAVFKAFNERKSYAVYGNLYLEHIFPIPSKNAITCDCHEIKALIASKSKNIDKVEIYRNGRKIFAVEDIGKKHYELCWRDTENIKNKNYIVHAEAQNDHLITAPINYK